ncbi:MAG TPA: class I SAM-dependent methyltransferase [Phycisphaerales bacterium]|nr:class I SAM-dependent methyltransferase [Phycisphaerales bacterium]
MPATPSTPDKHTLYELCVQSPGDMVPMLRAIHGGDPRLLGEDFAGSAALSYVWAESAAERFATAVDLDASALMRRPDHPRVARIVGDVRTAADPAERACDVLFVGNFSIGYLHTRAELVAYLRHARSRLRPGGVFVCDTYGGESAFLTGEVTRDHRLPDGRRVRYTWEQRDANPLTGMVTDVLHFQVDRAGEVEQRLPEAFVYHWRLWSVPELRDAMIEAGFAATEVYDRTPDATDAEGNAYVLPAGGDGDVEESFIVCVAARV